MQGWITYYKSVPRQLNVFGETGGLYQIKLDLKVFALIIFFFYAVTSSC